MESICIYTQFFNAISQKKYIYATISWESKKFNVRMRCLERNNALN